MGVTAAGIRRALRALAVLLALATVGAAPAHGATYAKGLDVSHWQGTIDWLQVADDGYTFAFAKATENTGFTDISYLLNRSGTQALGLRLGAYHFARPSGSGDAAVTAGAIAQADHFVDVAQLRAGDMPPVLDLEVTGNLAPAALTKWTQAWLGEVEARTGVQPLIYSSPSFWKTRLADTTSFADDGYRLWIAHWTKATAPLLPASDWGSQGWTFWQWTSCQPIPGIAKCSDADRANAPAPATFALPTFPTGAPASASPPTVLGAAKAGTRLAAVPGTWSGGKPVSFTYQWQSCDAAGGGCVPIVGATLPTYVPGAADVGHALVVSVTATARAGAAASVSPPTLAIAPAGAGAATRPAAIVPPQATGTPIAGGTLSGAVGTWSGSPTSFAFQWRRCDGAGASCAAIAGATGSTYVLSPGDIGSTISLVVTATGSGGAQSATAATTGVVAAAPVPPATVGSTVAPAGGAGAVVAADARATVTWQPGAVAAGTTVRLEPATAPPSIDGTAVTLTLSPAQSTLPWPLDVAYAASPAGQVAGFSVDGRTWRAVPPITTPTLQGAQLQGAYLAGGVLHVLTRQAGRVAVFRQGRWGDPSRVSPRAPVLRVVAGPTVTRRRDDGTLVLTARVSTSSQAHVNADVLATAGARPWILKRGSRLAAPLGVGATRRAQALVLQSGAFPVLLRLSSRSLPPRALVRVRLTAIDPWGRTGGRTISFRVP